MRFKTEDNHSGDVDENEDSERVLVSEEKQEGSQDENAPETCV